MIRCIPVDGSPAFEVEKTTAPLFYPTSTNLCELAYRSGVVIDVGHRHQTCRVRIESWRERAERLERELDATFGADTQWPLPDVLAKLAHAAELLFDQYNYDGHGYEEIVSARDAARAFLASFRQKAKG